MEFHRSPAGYLARYLARYPTGYLAVYRSGYLPGYQAAYPTGYPARCLAGFPSGYSKADGLIGNRNFFDTRNPQTKKKNLSMESHMRNSLISVNRTFHFQCRSIGSFPRMNLRQTRTGIQLLSKTKSRRLLQSLSGVPRTYANPERESNRPPR